PGPLAPRIPTVAPRSSRSETSLIAVQGRRLRPTWTRFVTPSTRSAGTLLSSGRSAAMLASRSGTSVLFGCASVVAVICVSFLAARKWNEPRLRSGAVRRVGSRLACVGRHVPDKQRTVGPIWPTARGCLREGGLAARWLPRGGHRSPAIDNAEGRGRAPVDQPAGHISEPPPGGGQGADVAPAAEYRSGAGGVSMPRFLASPARLGATRP